MKAFEKLYPKPPKLADIKVHTLWNEQRRTWREALKWVLLKKQWDIGCPYVSIRVIKEELEE